MATIVYPVIDGFNSASAFAYSNVPAPPALALPDWLAPILAIFPFPIDDPCCGGIKLVSCVRCSKDGRLYAPAKTMLTKEG